MMPNDVRAGLVAALEADLVGPFVPELCTTSMARFAEGSLFLVNERTAEKRDHDLAFALQVRLGLHYPWGLLARPNR